jgi:hypothetical protein
MFTDARKGWIAGGSGTILRTVDGGANWFELESRTDRLLYSVAFTDSLRGWVTGGNGAILSTIDGGGDPPPEPPPPPPPTKEGNRVSQNVPNPFNPATAPDGVTFIPFTLGMESPVTIRIFDALGAMLREIQAGTFAAGTHTDPRADSGLKDAPSWDGRDFRGNPVPSGVYFFQVITKEYIEAQNLVLVR